MAWLLTVGLWLISGSGEALVDTGTSEAAAVSETSEDAAAISDGSQDELAVGVVGSAGSGGFVAESYARDYSVSVDEAGRRLNRIGLLQEVMGSIRALEGSRVAGWGIDHGEDFGAWVWLAGDQQPGVEAARVAASHDDVEIRTGAAHTYEELRVAQDRIDPALITDDPETSSMVAAMVVYTGVDMAANSVKIGIDSDAGSGRSRRDATPQQESDTEGFAAEAALLGEALQKHTGIEVTVTDASGFAKTANFRAGNAMTPCTAGFAAKQVGGPYGLLTAGHCSNLHVMHGEILPFVVGGKGPRADAQLHQIPLGSSRQLTNDYVCGAESDSVCEVTGTQDRTDMMGDYVCHTGKNSGVSCGEVTDITIRLTLWYADGSGACEDKDGNGVACERVFVEAHGPNMEVCVGDSGGPVYDANGIAYGIVTAGSGSCGQKNLYIIFSVVKEIESYLSVKVLTEPVTAPGAAPQNLTAFLTYDPESDYRTNLKLTWNPVDDAAGYSVYRRVSESGSEYEHIGSALQPTYFDPVVDSSYPDGMPHKLIVAGHKYQYIVRANNANHLSEPSSDLHVNLLATKDLRAKTHLEAPVSDRGVQLDWKLIPPFNYAHVKFFRIYRREVGSGQGYERVGWKTVGWNKCCDYLDPISGLRPGAEYLYRIKPISWNYDVGSWGSRSDYAAVRVPTAKPRARVADPGTAHNGRLFRGIVVSWNEVEADAASYEIYRRAAVAGHPYERIATIGETEYYDREAGLTSGVEYYYRIKPVSSAGVVGHWGSRSNYAAVRLPALTGLQAAVRSDSASVTFTWAKPVGDVARYEVYRRAAIQGQPYTRIVDTTTASYSDPLTGLVPGAEYYYRVKAVSASGAVGGWGTGKNYARVVAPAVGGLEAVSVSGGVSVTWEQSAGDVARFKVYRRVAVQGQLYAEIAETTAASYLDRSAGLVVGTEYYYRVKPVGVNGVVGGWGPGPNYASIKYR